MYASRPHITALLGRAALGTVFAAGAIAVPFTGAVHASPHPTTVVPGQLGCLPILCPTDGSGIDIDLDLDLDILGGAPAEPAPPATPGRPAPLRPSDIVDLDAVVGVNVDLGDLAVVDATVPVDAGIGSSRTRPLAVGAATTPTLTATVIDGGTAPLADVDVSGLDVGVDAIVPGRDRSSAGSAGLAVADLSELSCLIDLAVIDTSDVRCSGGTLVGLATGLADVDGRVGLCNASVALFGSADRTRCASSATDPSDDPTNGATDGPVNDPTAGSNNSPGNGSAVSTQRDGIDRSTDRGGREAGGAADRASSIRRSQSDDTTEGSGLPVTGSSVVVTLALAAAVTALGAGGLLIKRRRVV